MGGKWQSDTKNQPFLHEFLRSKCLWSVAIVKCRQTGGFKRGRFPDLDLSLLFCPFLGLSDVPEIFLNFSGIVPIGPFPLSRLINFLSFC